MSADLVAIVGGRAVRALRGRALLHIWRRTTPHNWWIQGPRGGMYWHSGEPRRLPPLNLFELVHQSPEVIPPYLFGAGDVGMSELSTYRLRP